MIIILSTSLFRTVAVATTVVVFLCLPTTTSSLAFKPLSVVFSSTLEKINGAETVTQNPTTASSAVGSDVVNGNGGVNGWYDNDSPSTTTANGARSASNDPNNKGNIIEQWPGLAGESALRQVQFLASKVSESTDAQDESKYSLEARLRRTGGMTTIPFYENAYDSSSDIDDDDIDASRSRDRLDKIRERVKRRFRRSNRRKQNVKAGSGGEGGGVFNNAEYNMVARDQRNRIKGTKTDSGTSPGLEISSSSKRQEQVWTALANLEMDMQLLDNLAGQKPQLTALELFMLSASVTAAASGPWVLGGKLTEFLAPTAAAFSAAIGIGAEYVGRVAVADGKEVAASTIECAAEAEGLLANAERAKAVTPLCVGVGATATSFSLLVPVLFSSLDTIVLNEVYLACPLVSVLAAAVCSLALQDTKIFARRAASVGNRRFARSGLVGRTWLSAAEQITNKSTSNRLKWRTFCISVLPAPILGSLIPGTSIATKSIIVTALAAAQTAYFLAQCEYSLARATDAVAIKARSAAVCDTYANQGARSSAILPFTSALSGLCAAATAAIVELPFLESLSAAGTFASLTGEMAVVAFFPAFSSLFAAAASVSKARCEVQAEAAVQAASTLALEYTSNDDEDPILRPFRGVVELIRLTYASSIVEPYQRFLRRIKLSIETIKKAIRRRTPGGRNDPIKRNSDAQALAYMDY